MINLDYQITFQDDLDANETNAEYKLSLSWFKWILRGLSLLIILSGLGIAIATIEESQNLNDALLLIGLSILFIVIGLSVPWLTKPSQARSFFNRREIEKRWIKKAGLAEFRNLTLTETELILKTQFSETVYQRNCSKVFFEGKKGLVVRFYGGQNRYIPKRIFENRQQIEKLKNFCQN